MSIYEKFDCIGILVFLYIFIDALVEVKKTKKPSWNVYIRLLIGTGGLLVDSFLVFFV